MEQGACGLGGGKSRCLPIWTDGQGSLVSGRKRAATEWDTDRHTVGWWLFLAKMSCSCEKTSGTSHRRGILQNPGQFSTRCCGGSTCLFLSKAPRGAWKVNGRWGGQGWGLRRCGEHGAVRRGRHSQVLVQVPEWADRSFFNIL